MKATLIYLVITILWFIEMGNLFIFLLIKEQVFIPFNTRHVIETRYYIFEYFNEINCFIGSGFMSHDLYLHGFFSASIKLPSDYTAGVVVAFYVSFFFLP